jgi:hypothetical protein
MVGGDFVANLVGVVGIIVGVSSVNDEIGSDAVGIIGRCDGCIIGAFIGSIVGNVFGDFVGSMVGACDSIIGGIVGIIDGITGSSIIFGRSVVGRTDGVIVGASYGVLDGSDDYIVVDLIISGISIGRFVGAGGSIVDGFFIGIAGCIPGSIVDSVAVIGHHDSAFPISAE